MNKLAKRARQMLTMLLATSMLAGSVPMNGFAMEEAVSIVETAEKSEEILQTENDLESVNEETEDTMKQNNGVPIQKILENGNDTVSGNGNESASENETDGKIQIAFCVQEEAYSSYVEVITVTEDVTIEGNKVSTIPGKELEFKNLIERLKEVSQNLTLTELIVVIVIIGI